MDMRYVNLPVQIGILRLDRPLTEPEYNALWGLLPLSRRERLASQPTEKHAEVLCAYGLLLALLRERYGWQTLPPMETDAHGRPRFAAYPGVFFSVSHTAGVAAAAVSDAPVGVDIQRVRPVSDRMLRLAGATTAERFFRDWVRWEARAKRAGGGLLPMVRRERPLCEGEVYSPLASFPHYEAGVAADSPVRAARLLSTEDLFKMLF